MVFNIKLMQGANVCKEPIAWGVLALRLETMGVEWHTTKWIDAKDYMEENGWTRSTDRGDYLTDHGRLQAP